MKTRINNLKCVVPVLLTVLIVFCPFSSVYANIIPVSDRTPQVRDAIVAAIPDVSSADGVRNVHLATITRLNLRAAGISRLKLGDFSGLTALRTLNLYNNELSSLPKGIFEGLTALTTLRLGKNAIDPFPLIVTLRQVSDSMFQAVIPTGAPFDIVLPIDVTNGSISNGATMITIPKGSIRSDTFTVVPMTDTSTPPIVRIGVLPRLPANHYGYTFARSTACTRTLQVQKAITAAVPEVTDCRDVTDKHLKTIQTLDLRNRGISTLRAEDFLGLPSLKNLYLSGNQLRNLPTDVFSGLSNLESLHLHRNRLSNLPADIFSGLSSLRHLYLHNNQLRELNADVFSELPSLTYLLLNNNRFSSLSPNVFRGLSAPTLLFMYGNTASPLTLTVSLEKVGENRFKVTVPAGAPFDITLSLSVTNGNITGSTENMTIAAGNVESTPFTVTRTPGTSDSVTVDIKDLSSLPIFHLGYEVVTSEDLPLEVLPSLNSPPIFTDGAITTRSVAENTVTNANIGAAIAATDRQKDKLTYTLGGTDAAAFAIDSATGQLKTKTALDYETKNSYAVTLTVSDGKSTDTISVTIRVSDVNEAPTFNGGDSITRSIAENTATGKNIGAAITATDPDDNTLTYSLGGTDASAFALNPKTGQLKTKAALDYERKKTWTVTLTVSDGKLTDTITVTINVTDVVERATKQVTEVKSTPNNAPEFMEGSSTIRSVPENTSSGVGIGTAVSAIDADGIILIYTLSGTNANAFSVDKTTGQLRTSAALDYETKKSYTVTLTVSDGELTDTITVTINITDVVERSTKQVTEVETTPNASPVFTEGSTTTRTVLENTPSGVDIGAAVFATDVDGDTLTYTLSGIDASAFSVDKTTGQLRTNVTLDYETKSPYTVTLTVSDGSLTDSITVTVYVTDVSETNSAPVFNEGTSTTRSVAENAADGTNVGSPVSATDPDNDDLNYTLGGTDSYAFYIVNTTGQLQISTALDYETKNTYTVTVSVTDSGGESSSITVTINIIDITAPNYPLYGRTQQVQDAISGGYPADSVTTARLADINWLEIEDKGISALKAGDFAGLTALKTLNLGRNSISNISPLRNLTTLQSLSLYENSISNISPLANLTRLTFLNASDNSISNISALRNLTKLTNLGLSNNSISDISVVGNLTALTELSLWHNSIDDISALKNLTALTSLYLSHNSIDDISAVGNLTKLTILDLSHNSISDISAVGKLTKLDYLSLGHNSISDISAVGKLTALAKLGLYNNAISDISAVGKLTSLIWLDISNNSITDVSAVENLTKLDALFLKGNPLPDYGPLRRLKAANPDISIDIDINNNPPVFSDGDSTTRSIAENSPAGIDIGSAVSATDSDTNDTLTYTLGGTDAESFDIVSTSGQLQTKASLDYETKTSYTVTIDVSDGNDGLDRITVTINVTDVANAAPSVEISPAPPLTTALLSNYPNPFNPETWIPYQLAKPSEVTIMIYDIRGHIVRQLKLGHQAAGVYRSRSKAAHWDGRNHFGVKVATGVYFYRLTAGDFSATRKMLILK